MAGNAWTGGHWQKLRHAIEDLKQALKVQRDRLGRQPTGVQRDTARPAPEAAMLDTRRIDASPQNDDCATG